MCVPPYPEAKLALEEAILMKAGHSSTPNSSSTACALCFWVTEQLASSEETQRKSATARAAQKALREKHLHESRGTRNYTAKRTKLDLFGEETQVLFSQTE